MAGGTGHQMMNIQIFEGSTATSVQGKVNDWLRTHRCTVEDMRMTVAPRGPMGLLGNRYCVMLVLAGCAGVDRGLTGRC